MPLDRSRGWDKGTGTYFRRTHFRPVYKEDIFSTGHFFESQVRSFLLCFVRLGLTFSDWLGLTFLDWLGLDFQLAYIMRFLLDPIPTWPNLACFFSFTSNLISFWVVIFSLLVVKNMSTLYTVENMSHFMYWSKICLSKMCPSKICPSKKCLSKARSMLPAKFNFLLWNLSYRNQSLKRVRPKR